ncbi:MAG TPA: YceI family protein [Anaerolineales bacterium]|nr:YceI family protein [Anaerolineales bacterium]
MKRIITLSILLSILLAACSSAPQNTTLPDATTSAPLATGIVINNDPTATDSNLPEVSPTGPAPTAESTPTEPVATGPVEYQIDATGSSVSYEVGETFFNQNNRINVAIGVTNGISGSIQLDPVNPQNTTLSDITVDVSQFASDSGRRDRAIQDRFLESGRYPTATFSPTQITGLPEQYIVGEMLSFQVTGDLTVREAARPVTFDVQASLNEGILGGQATTTILMSDFGVGPIQMAGILGTEDEVKISFTFVARPVN